MELVVLILCAFTTAQAQSNRLPDNFLVGFATASYQVEGAWNEKGKGEHVWDRATHSNPNFTDDGSTGDIATDQYHKYIEDVGYMKQIGAQLYRFSLSWSRLLPDGLLPNVNQDGVDYYNNLINLLLQNGIEPMVTLFHWDLPQRLQDLGGWPNPLLAEYFEDYARLAFSLFGDRVKYWITFNEPLETCKTSYGQDGGAPAINMSGVAEYLCTHTLLQSHARAYHVYNDTFRAQQNGSVGITLSSDWFEPNSDNQTDKDASETVLSFQIGWFADPIFSTDGDYPPVMRRQVDENSATEGRPRSRLPKFTPEEVKYIRGTYDFYGVNHYTSFYATPANPPEGVDPSWDRDQRVKLIVDPAWPGGASSWLNVVPWGIRSLLNYLKDKYNNPKVFITENGYSDRGGVEDDDRIDYHSSYIQEVINAVKEDGCNVLGYTAWSLLDNFEWQRGYTEKFGVIAVDFNSSNRTRTPKKSASWFRDLISNQTLPSKSSTGKWELSPL